jgi:aspartyl-tRNA(Asn)/glutamyl-tRNA(Gln) amidotransferase subunit A
MVWGALGSDTGGSIRQPAAFCGVVGMKPSYGAVSRFGLIAMGSSLDVVGPIARTVADARMLFQVIAGRDLADATSLPSEYLTQRAELKSRPVRVGVNPAVVEHEGLDAKVRATFLRSIEALRAAGWEVREVDLPLLRETLAIYYILMPAEASTNLARFDGVRYGPRREDGASVFDAMKATRALFGAEVKRRILLGTYVLSSGYYDAYYRTARRARHAFREALMKVFQDVDVIALPTTPHAAFPLGAKTKDPLAMYLEDVFTVPANIAGVPAISLPMGRDDAGLPLGMQLLAPFGFDYLLLSIAEEVEAMLSVASHP